MIEPNDEQRQQPIRTLGEETLDDEVLTGVREPALIELKSGKPSLSVRATNRLLRRQDLARFLARAQVIEAVVATVTLPKDEERKILLSWLKPRGVTNESSLERWLQDSGWTFEDLVAVATLQERLKRYAHWRFAKDVEVRFLDRKQDLDQVTYSLLRVSDQALAEELYFRLREGEASFDQLALSYTEGTERRTRGLIGPIAVSSAHEELSSRLRIGNPSQLWPPFQIGQQWLVVRLEERFPAQLDDETRMKMELDLFGVWLDSQISMLLAGESLLPPPAPPTPL